MSSVRARRAGLEIREVDVGDDADFEAWHAAQAQAQRHGREATAAVWTREEQRLMLREPSTRRWRQPYVALSDGVVVGTGLLGCSLVDNLDNAELEVGVIPGRRGRGIGTEILSYLERVASGRGLRVLQGEVAWPIDAHPDGIGNPDVEFVQRRGFELGLVDIQRQLRLPLGAGLLEDLAADVAARHPAYRLEAWSGPVPAELLAGWASLAATLMTEAPTGGMDRADEQVDLAAVRAGEALIEKQGRTTYNAVALDEHGTVVAYTDIVTTVHEPGRSYQWGTLVHRDHRGHRLGLAVKVANLLQLTRTRPDIEVVRTWNAQVNTHMVDVNERLGFVPLERMGEFQKRLP